MANPSWTRRRLLATAMALLGGSWLGYGGRMAPAGAAPTPSCDEDDVTEALTEGPFYTPDSPAKSDLRGDGPGQAVRLSGRVIDTDCEPLPGAIVDLWHADDEGRYDNQGYRFRGHQRTGRDGGYGFDTILPGRYGSRTRHYHVKIAAPGRPVLTTQLYFPGEAANGSDWLFREDLLVAWDDSGPIPVARFEFVLPAA